ncbi:MAG: GFA family protein [bacterium]|nr:GFA family protein [bacterium]
METYEGACHCRNIRYQVELDLTQPVTECNCSHCQMKGFLLQFTTPDKLTILQGEEELNTYRFNKHVIEHMFCSDCGVEPFGRGANPDGTPAVAINVRTIDGIDIGTLTRMPYDGKAA